MPETKAVLVVPEREQAARDREIILALADGYRKIFCHEDDAALPFTTRTFSGGNLAPCRDDLADIARLLAPDASDIHVVWPTDPLPPYLKTSFRLMGCRTIVRVDGRGGHPIVLPPLPKQSAIRSLLLKMSGGIGNVVLATFILSTSLKQGWKTFFCPVSDVDGASLAQLYDGGIPEDLTVVRPENLDEIAADVTLNIEDHANRVETDFFHGPYRVGVEGHEPGYAARFFENVTGVTPDTSETFIGGDPAVTPAALRNRIIVCPGSKTGWDSKRWPHMNELLKRLDDPIVLCRQADLDRYSSLEFLKPINAANAEVLTGLTLREATALLKNARAVISNDCGPAHMAAAAGVPTLVLFGPSSIAKNRHARPNVRIVSLGLECQPCQGATSGPGRLGPEIYECSINYQCLVELGVDRVLDELAALEATAKGTK